MSKIDYLSNVTDVIRGEKSSYHNSENTSAMTAHSHENYHVPKHPDASQQGLGTDVLSICMIVKTNRDILAESESVWIRPNMPEGFLESYFILIR